MNRKTLTDNLALALVLLGVGVVGGRAAGGRDAPARQDASAAAAQQGSRSVVLLREDFESGSVLSVGQGYAPVAYGTPNLGGSGAYWGRTVAKAAYGLFSSWCAGDGWNSPAEPPYGANCIPYYGSPACLVPSYTNATMTTAPLNLSAYTTGLLSYNLWLSTEAADWFSVEASVDGVNFHGYTYVGFTDGNFVPRQLVLGSWPVLGNLMGHEQVWFRFGYSSDGTELMGGAFVDDITIEVDNPDLVFGDGFESGDPSLWSSSQG